MLPGFISFPVVGISAGITELYNAPADDLAGTFTGVPLGNDIATRRIVVLAWHADAAVSPGNTPTCTVAGAATTRVFADTTGNGAGPACGVAMFIGQPTGTSGTVQVNWAASAVRKSIVVLGLNGYSSTATASGFESAAGSNGQVSISTPIGGCIISMASSGDNGSAFTWTNITEKGDQLFPFGGSNNRMGWAWDIRTTGSAVNATVTPWATGQGDNTMGVASFPLL